MKNSFWILFLLSASLRFGADAWAQISRTAPYTHANLSSLNDTTQYPCGYAGSTTQQITTALAAVPGSSGVVDTSCYQTAQTITSDIFSPVSNNITLIVTQTLTVNANATIPANIELCTYNGGQILAGTGFTLTNNARACNPSANTGVGTIIDTTTQPGADCGARTANALTIVYSLGFGGVDMRNEKACTISADLYLGNGTATVSAWLPFNGITRNATSAGPSAKIFYNSHVTLYMDGGAITGPSEAGIAGVQQAPNSNQVSDAHFVGPGSISATGTNQAGSVALQVGGPNAVNLLQAPSNFPYNNNYISAGMTGTPAEVAIYNYALTAAQVSNHYCVGAQKPACVGTAYEATILGDMPLSFWPLSGTTLSDATGSTRTASLIAGTGTLNTSSSIPGDSGATAPTLNGAAGWAISMPAYNYFTGGDYSLEGWTYATASMPNGATAVGFYGNYPSQNYRVLALIGNVLGADVMLVNPNYKRVLSRAASTPLNQWWYWTITYHAGSISLYVDGNPLILGTDVEASTFSHLTLSADTGLEMNSENGCICYNKLYDVSPFGTSFGAQILNSSGFPVGVNQNEFFAGQYGGAIGLYDAGGYKNTFIAPDLENQKTHNGGGILAAQPTNQAHGANYVNGDTVTVVQGSNTSASLTVACTVSGAVGCQGQSLSLVVKTPGTGYTTATNLSTTGGSGTGLAVDIAVANYEYLGSSAEEIDSPYEEAGVQDFICGSDNEVNGPLGSFNGSYYTYTLCSGTTGIYGGPKSNFFWGAGATPASIGISGIGYVAYGLPTMYDTQAASAFTPSSVANANLYGDGPTWNGQQASTFGHYGHSNWNTGALIPHAGILATGKASFSALANPSVPTVTVGAGSGSTGYTYALSCADQNGGTTMTGTFSSSVNGPAALGAWLTVTPVTAGGSGTVNTSGTGVTSVTGTGFLTGTAWAGATITIAGTAYTVASVTSSSALVLTTSAGNQTGATYSIPVGGYAVNDVLTISAGATGDGAAQATVTTVDANGNPTAYSVTTAGSEYRTIARQGSGDSTTFATTGGSGIGATVTGTTSYMIVAYTLADGCYTFNVLRNANTSAVNFGLSGYTDEAAAVFDFGNTTTVVAPTRNTTADVSMAGQFTSTLGTGTAPFVVASTTPVANLSIGGNAGTATSATTAGNGYIFKGTITLNSSAWIAGTAGSYGTGAIASAAYMTFAVAVTGASAANNTVCTGSFSGAFIGITGFVPSTGGGLQIAGYPTTGYCNFTVVNDTTNSISLPNTTVLNVVAF
jgi:hypothetical protein